MMKKKSYESINELHNKASLSAEIAGWYGMLAIIGAYALVSFKIIPSDSIWFQALNLTGAIGLIWIAWVKNVRQSVVLNVFWAIIAVIAIATIFMK